MKAYRAESKTATYRQQVKWHVMQGMEGASMGIWCAHGEGRAVFPDSSVQQRIMSEGLAPIRWAV